jgi:hypothetical protein
VGGDGDPGSESEGSAASDSGLGEDAAASSGDSP